MKRTLLILLLSLTFIYIKAQLSTCVSNASGGSASLSGGGHLAWSVGEPIIGTTYEPNVTLTQGILQTWPNAMKNILLTLYLEGLFNGVSMNKACNGAGYQYADSIVDKIAIELHNVSNYSLVAYSTSDVAVNANGQASIRIPGTHNGAYYLTVKHRNSIETTSSVPISLVGSTIAYQFVHPSKVYAGNVKLINGHYCIYSGDVNQDGVINTLDIDMIDNEALNFGKGYLPTDLNGDGLIDALDLILADNNAALLITTQRP
jgi:hypothetical protein